MRIFAYRAVQHGPRSLTDLLQSLIAKPISDRLFEGKAAGIRLEAAGLRGDFLFADFAAKRFGHGPGRMADHQPIAEIALGPGESFGEDTGLVCHVPSGHVAVQYNHTGPRVSRIAQYLFAADLSLGGQGPRPRGVRDEERYGFGLGAVLRRGAHQRIREMGLVRQLEFEVAVPGAHGDDIEAGQSLSGILNAPLPDGIERLRVTMIATEDRGSHMDRNEVMGFVNDLLDARRIVRHAKVKGRQFDLGQTEDLNLLDEQLSIAFDVPVGAGGRFARTDRWTALERALTGWIEGGDIAWQP